ncbi:MAG: TonB-dependent receptor [Gemmatimonadota bacterium]
MKQTVVKALARSARAVALAAVVSGLGATALVAQSTGKLEGRVRDPGGQPVANARVAIVGSAASAVANPQGYYFINNVPAGDFSIRVSYVGYKPVEVSNVKMLSGQTITQDITLTQTAVTVQEITVVAAQNALVPRDKVTSKQLVDGSYTDKLPVDRIGSVLALQPGVASSPGGGTLSVRGGRGDENATYIDGVPVAQGNRGTGAGRGLTATGSQQGNLNAPSTGTGTVGVGTNSFEDASVTTGASSAEFGGAQGGVISITTKTGGSRFAGNVGYETDELAGQRYGQGYNRLQASLGGPIMKDFTFFVGGVLEGAKSGLRGYNGWEVPNFVRTTVDTTYAVPRTRNSATSDTFQVPVYKYAMFRGECDNAVVANASDPDMRDNYGYECHGNRSAYAPTTNIQLTSKLNYSFGQGSRVSLSYITSSNQNRGQRGADGTAGTLTRNNVATLNWTQTLSKNASRAIALDAYLSYQWDRSINSTLTAASEESTRNPFNGWLLKNFDFIYDMKTFPVTDELVRNYRIQQAGTPITVYDRFNTSQYNGNTGWGGAPDGVGMGAGGGGTAPGVLSTASENRLVGKANLDWQLDRYNRVKFGGEYTKYTTSTYNIGATGQSFSDIWLAKPIRYNVFAEDRLDLGDVVLVGGLRYDYFDVGASHWKDFPRISSAPGFTPETVDNYLTPFKSHNYLSPHIQVAFPVTERTNFRLSYAQQVQQPDFSVVLFGSNTDLSITNTNNNYGSDLDFGKSILFEFGVSHAFSDDMVLDLTVYNKDNLANPAGRLIPLTDPIGNDRNDIRLTVNQDFGNTRGLDLRLDRRFGNIFNGTISYSFQDAKNTGSDPYSYINYGSRILSGLGGTNASPPQQAQPVGTSRPHNIAGQAAFNFPADYKSGSLVGSIMKRVGIFSTFRYAAGTPYTRCPATEEASINVTSGNPCGRELAGDFNAARLPAYKEFNLRVTKGFAVGKLDFTAYADGRNILNLKNIGTVFTTTGSIQNVTSQDRAWTGDSTTFANFAKGNGAYNNASGTISLPTSNAGCANYADASGNSAGPSCYYYRKSEQRFGNGDGVYTLAEQRRASDNNQLGNYHVSRFAFAGRTVRFGMEVNF